MVYTVRTWYEPRSAVVESSTRSKGVQGTSTLFFRRGVSRSSYSLVFTSVAADRAYQAPYPATHPSNHSLKTHAPNPLHPPTHRIPCSRQSWRAGKGGDRTADGMFMSPVSTVTCSPRAIGCSPRTMAASPPPGAGTGVGGRGRSQRGPGTGNAAAMDSLDWWSELELSPPRGADSSSLKQWRWVGGMCPCVYGWRTGGMEGRGGSQ